MTGFGRGEVARDGFRAVFELSTVNSRFLEVSLRLPRWLMALEGPLRALVDQQISRGKVTAQLTWERTAWAPSQTLNEPQAAWYIENLRRLAEKHGLSGELHPGDLVGVPDLWVSQVESLDPLIEAILRESLQLALADLQRTRRAEGEALAADLRERLRNVGAILEEIRTRAVEVPAQIRDRLNGRIAELLGTGGCDPQRLAQEVAFLADRADVTEECVRLEVHRRQAVAALEGNEGAVGRRLNFLVQELNREANTIGAKSASSEMSSAVVRLKEELERIREQVQNIE